MPRNSEYRNVYERRQSAKSANADTPAKSTNDDMQNKSYMTIEPDAPKRPSTEVVPPTKENPSGYPVTPVNRELQQT